MLEIDGDAPQHVKADLLRSHTCYPVILLLISFRRGTHNITLMTNFREYEENQKTVESGVKTDLDDEMIASSGKAVRDPKFMVYWLTTTK